MSKCVCVLFSIAVMAALPAAEHRISTASDFRKISRSTKAGDSIVLSNGVWRDVQLLFDSLPGTESQPIFIKAETPGEVILTGRSQLQFSGRYVVVSGLVFRDIDGVSDVCSMRSHSQRHAHQSRVTDCIFQQTSKFDAQTESRWLSVYGTQNRIDHCCFAGKTTRGATLVVWVAEQLGRHRIDHNHFGHRPVLGENGGETIRLGTSHVSEFESATIVEENYFKSCDGEAEIISNKSCGNIYRHNIFDQCSGALTLRHGHRCLVDSNVFLGRNKKGSGGVRIIGRDHTVTNNYFESLRGDAHRAAVSMMNGVANSPLNEYAPVERALVAHNTFIDCKVSLEFGVGAGEKQSVVPKDCNVINNLFVPGTWQIAREPAEPENFSYSGNICQVETGPTTLRPGFKRSAVSAWRRDGDGMQRPEAVEGVLSTVKAIVATDIDAENRGAAIVCGCDDPGTAQRSLASPKTTGPTWNTSSKADNAATENAVSKSELTLPVMSDGPPAAGRRVPVTAAEYMGTEVHHTLYLPSDWTPDTNRKWPVIVEYTGNHFPLSGSTGEVEGAGLGYGISSGQFIWVTLPFVSEDGKSNAVKWWGDIAATVRYATENVPRICEQFGGDSQQVFLCGFSRGAIATSFIGLHDDRISRLWCGFISHDHFDGEREWRGTKWGSPLAAYQAQAIQRLQRLGGRPFLVCQSGSTEGIANFVKSAVSAQSFTFLDVNTASILGSFPNDTAIHPHTDRWLLKDSEARQVVQKWVNAVQTMRAGESHEHCRH